MKIIISGYFCTGKTSVIKALGENLDLHKPKCYTTRKMRPQEREGFPYNFITDKLFSQLHSQDKLFDPIEHDGHQYAGDYEELFGDNNWVMDILPDSWPVYKKIPGVIGIYLNPPKDEVLRERAIMRGDDSISIEKRIRSVKHDIDTNTYDYVIDPQESFEALLHKILKIVNSILQTRH